MDELIAQVRLRIAELLDQENDKLLSAEEWVEQVRGQLQMAALAARGSRAQQEWLAWQDAAAMCLIRAEIVRYRAA